MPSVNVLVIGSQEAYTVFRQVLSSNSALTGRIQLRTADPDNAVDAVRDAEVIVCGNVSDELVIAAPNLRWVSFWSAGMEAKARPPLLERGLVLTNASGLHAPNIAEHVIAFMLMFSRRMPLFYRRQVAGEWNRDFPAEVGEPGELNGQTLLVVGLGRIGEALAVRGKAFDMYVIAVKRDPAARYNGDVRPDELHAPNALPELLGRSDHVAIALPLTPQTRHLFDAAMLAHVKRSAYIYNIARGAIIDEAALIDALRDGRIAGAGLDVFEEEPLPSDSALWHLPNVLITPHVSGLTPHYFQRAADLFAANLTRYIDGEPLCNRYDPRRGY